MIEKQLTTIQIRIRAIKQELLEIEDMRPGSLTKQQQKRSISDKVFEYWQLSYTHKMKSHTDYISQDLVRQTREQVKTFKRFKSLIDEWIDLAIQGAKISAKLERQK